MKYKPQCDSCKHFITTDKSPKAVKSKRYKSIWFLDLIDMRGHCKLSYCVKEKKQVYRKNMR